MLDGNTLLTNVDCSRGAPMGRRTIEDNPNATVVLFRMRMVDECYDVAGAYWGSGTPIYAAIGEGFQYFVRAKNLDEAKTEILNQYPDLAIQLTEVNDDFVDSYIRAMLWLSLDENEDPLDKNYQSCDISPELMATIQEDCRKFLGKVGHLIVKDNYPASDNPFEQAGYDFWLTRSHSGCGFDDGDWADSAAGFLTIASQQFKELTPFVQDGKIYAE